MKICKHVLYSTIILFSGLATAASTQTQYRCSAGGCEIRCSPTKGTWKIVEKASVSLLTVNHDNGNVEMFIDDGPRGNRTLLVSQKNLLCKISNYIGSKIAP